MSSRRLAIIVLFVAAVVSAAGLQWQVPLDTTQTARTASVTTGTLEVRAGLDANRLHCPFFDACSQVHVWFLFENRSKTPVDGLRIVNFQAPGFMFDPNDPALAALFTPEFSLAGQASRTISVTLAPLAGSGRYNVTAVYEWANPAGGELRGSISLGPVEISSWWRRPIANAAGRIKDLALPLILALAGWLLQNEQKKRDDLQVVLTTLLPTHIHDTKKYYLPFAARAYALSRRIRLVDIAQEPDAAGQVPSPEEQRMARLRCAHAFFALLKQYRFVVRGIGGIQFKNHDGERVLKFAIRFFMLEVTEYRISQDVQDRVMAKVKLHQNFGELSDALGWERWSRGPLTAGVDAIVRWIDDPGEPMSKILPLLTILHQVLLYEMDIPMELWYREPREFPRQALSDANTALNALATRARADSMVRKPGIEKELQQTREALRDALALYIVRKTPVSYWQRLFGR